MGNQCYRDESNPRDEPGRKKPVGTLNRAENNILNNPDDDFCHFANLNNENT